MALGQLFKTSFTLTAPSKIHKQGQHHRPGLAGALGGADQRPAPSAPRQNQRPAPPSAAGLAADSRQGVTTPASPAWPVLPRPDPRTGLASSRISFATRAALARMCAPRRHAMRCSTTCGWIASDAALPANPVADTAAGLATGSPLQPSSQTRLAAHCGLLLHFRILDTSNTTVVIYLFALTSLAAHSSPSSCAAVARRVPSSAARANGALRTSGGPRARPAARRRAGRRH